LANRSEAKYQSQNAMRRVAGTERAKGSPRAEEGNRPNLFSELNHEPTPDFAETEKADFSGPVEGIEGIEAAPAEEQAERRPEASGHGEPAPQLQLVRVGDIELHPALTGVYAQLRLKFPPAVQLDYLTFKGILKTARFLPIHVVRSEEKFQCFAGTRLGLAALNTLQGDTEIEVLVYPSVSLLQISEALEIEQDILYVWHRQSSKERKAQELRYWNSTSPNDLRTPLTVKDQQIWKEILKVSLRTIVLAGSIHRTSPGARYGCRERHRSEPDPRIVMANQRPSGAFGSRRRTSESLRDPCSCRGSMVRHSQLPGFGDSSSTDSRTSARRNRHPRTARSARP
jgi:hypothetical protein